MWTLKRVNKVAAIFLVISASVAQAAEVISPQEAAAIANEAAPEASLQKSKDRETVAELQKNIRSVTDKINKVRDRIRQGEDARDVFIGLTVAEVSGLLWYRKYAPKSIADYPNQFNINANSLLASFGIVTTTAAAGGTEYYIRIKAGQLEDLQKQLNDYSVHLDKIALGGE